MTHIPIDKVLYALSGESGARPSIDLAARIPGTSRVERTKAKGQRQAKYVEKGLALSAVVKTRISAREYHIRTHRGEYVGLILKQNDSKKPYGYRLKGGTKTIPGYSTQVEAIRAMLTNV